MCVKLKQFPESRAEFLELGVSQPMNLLSSSYLSGMAVAVVADAVAVFADAVAVVADAVAVVADAVAVAVAVVADAVAVVAWQPEAEYAHSCLLGCCGLAA